MDYTIPHDDLVDALAQTVGIEKAQAIVETGLNIVGLPERSGYRTTEVVRLCDAITWEYDGYIEIVADEFKIRTQAEKRFYALFENVPDPATVLEFEGGDPIVRAVNDAFTDTFGYTERELAGESLNEFIVPPAQSEEATEIDRAVIAGDRIEREVQRETAAGQRRDFLFRSIPVEKETGGIEAYGIYTDITDRRRRTRKLEERNERLEEFATVVTHDLRNPLSIAHSHLSFAMADLDEAADGYEFLTDVEGAIDRMDRLIDDLLALARHGQRVSELTAVEFAEIVTEAWAELETADAELVVADDGTLMADPDRLSNLLVHLFDNAVTHGGSDVTVTVGLLPEGFSVEDDGPGIPAGKRERVLEYGYTTESGGTGLGLSIVKSIAEAHEWEIDLSESDAGGARFEITGVTLE